MHFIGSIISKNDLVPLIQFEYNDIHNAKCIYINRVGPARLFAALLTIELDYKPIIIERSKNIRDHRPDLASINKQGILVTDSNY